MVEEKNFRPPVPAGEELIGLEYLFAQSSHTFNAPDHYSKTREELTAAEDEEEVSADSLEDEEEDSQDDDDAPDDAGYTSESDSFTPLKMSILLTDQTVATDLDPSAEDVCGPNHLPGYQHVEELSSVLVEVALEEGKLAISENTRQRIISAWNKLELHDRSIQKFDSLYSARWGYVLFGRTCGDAAEASLVQKLKFTKRFAAAHLLDSRKNRLMYCTIKMLWLHPGCGGKARGSPQKQLITKAYQLAQHKVTVDDPQLSKLGIPLLKINSKCVADFIRRQEALSARNTTDQGWGIVRPHHSLSATSQPPAPELPDERPHTSRPQVKYEVPQSLAGTRKLTQRHPKQHTSHTPHQILPAPPSVFTPAQQLPASTLQTVKIEPQRQHASSSTVPALTIQPQQQASSSTLPALTIQPQHQQSPASTLSAQTSEPYLTLTFIQPSPTPSQSVPQPVVMSKSAFYKRKREERLSGQGSSQKRPVTMHMCSLCGQSTQNHKKYRKKTYCPLKQASTSKELSGQTFKTFEDFQMAVDALFLSHIPGVQPKL